MNSMNFGKKYSNKFISFLRKERKHQILKFNFNLILEEKNIALSPIDCLDEKTFDNSSFSNDFENISSAFNSCNSELHSQK